jgi:pimeloyl-ACP methyl ester carboxylesterase
MTPYDMPQEELEKLWANITCPTLLAYGEKSWASNPAEDGRVKHFRNATVKLYKDAGHWLHHDKLDEFVADLKAFL